MNPSLTLSPEAFNHAAAFMRQARPLDQALFAFHFESAPAAKALAALQDLQNNDGGFYGLEADIGFPASTVLSTCHALHTLHELRAPASHPLVQRALDYLLGAYDHALEAWPIIPPHDNSQPHAPWWHYSENFAAGWGRFQDNPRPDALACLFIFSCDKTNNLRQHVSRSTLSRLRSASADMDMHGLWCYLRLYAAPGLPGKLKQELERVLPAWIDRSVERDPAKWTGYGLRPLNVAPAVDSPWRARLESDIENNLNFLIQNQAADGSWHPHWNWGDSFLEAWPAAKLKWQAVLTLANLRTLRSYRRLPC